MTRVENFIKKAKCKNNHCSAMSNSTWCELNSEGDNLKIHDLCHKPKCKCQKQITFTTKQFQLEGAGFKKTMGKLFGGTEKMWKNLIEPGLKIATPIIPAVVSAKTRILK